MPVRGLDLPPLCHGWGRNVLPPGNVLFGDIEEDELVPGQFDSPPTKKLRVEAEKEETKVGEASGLINPSDNGLIFPPPPQKVLELISCQAHNIHAAD